MTVLADESSRQTLDRFLTGCFGIIIAMLSFGLTRVPAHLAFALCANLVLSVVGFFVARSALESPALHTMFLDADLKGIDLNKSSTTRDANGVLVRPIKGKEIPESQGTIAAVVYIIVLSVFIPFAFAGYVGRREYLNDFPHQQLSEYLAAMLSVGLAAFMGFADDVLDLRWRHKIPLPFLANLPLVLVYLASGGATGVSVPNPLRWLLGSYIELSFLFFFALLLVAVFSTHAINILAGVNGLEVGQAVVVAAAVCCLNVFQLARTTSDEYTRHHVQSLVLILPFLATSLALLRANWFPSRVFAGDTYCYFAGATLFAASVVGHFSKTMVRHVSCHGLHDAPP
jgi:UDP-N-acetylglucosamine--dolichyl-phosphate N-acetylglucosaminephosphotransferase